MHREFFRIVPAADTAVLFIHGIVGTPRHFDDLIALLPNTVSVHNLLLAGHGGSARDFARTSMREWEAQVVSPRTMEELQRNPHIAVLPLPHAGHYYYPAEDEQTLREAFCEFIHLS